MGRLTRDPNVRYTQQNGSQESMCVARYTLAVDRRGARDGQQSADFISCVAFGKNGEFAEKYLKQGTKIVITGRIQTGSYTNRDGQKVYTTDGRFCIFSSCSISRSFFFVSRSIASCSSEYLCSSVLYASARFLYWSHEVHVPVLTLQVSYSVQE